MKALICGIASEHARLVALQLVERGHEVVGIDQRPWRDPPEGITVFQADVRKRPAEDVFRSQRPDTVIHMGTVSHFELSRDERYRINLGGTRAVIDNCAKYGVAHVVFVSRHTVYGAAADAPLFRTEQEPPLGGSTFPDLADLVAADLYAAQTIWRHPNISTAVLRMAYALGPKGRGTLANFLRGPRVPMVLGFDPLFQFMHDFDAASAITSAAEHSLSGVFNVAGPPPIPLSVLARHAGRTSVPMPEPVLKRVLGKWGFPRLPTGAIPHLKYPVIVDDGAFRAATQFEHRYDDRTIIGEYREAHE